MGYVSDIEMMPGGRGPDSSNSASLQLPNDRSEIGVHPIMEVMISTPTVNQENSQDALKVQYLEYALAEAREQTKWAEMEAMKSRATKDEHLINARQTYEKHLVSMREQVEEVLMRKEEERIMCIQEVESARALRAKSVLESELRSHLEHSRSILHCEFDEVRRQMLEQQHRIIAEQESLRLSEMIAGTGTGSEAGGGAKPRSGVP